MLPGKHEELKTDGFNLGYKKPGNITEPLLSKIKVMSYNYVELYSEMGSLQYAAYITNYRSTCTTIFGSKQI